MIAAESMIGFALVFLALAFAGSLLLAGTVALLHARLRALGAAVERAASALAISAPVVIAFGASLLLALRSWSIGPDADHCLAHSHHLHLCVFHGVRWGHEAWAVAALAGSSTWIAFALLRRVHAFASSHFALRRIRAVATATSIGSTEIVLAPAASSFCFAAGLLVPRIYVSTAAWARWSSEERHAAIEHERAHLLRRDLLRRAVLGVLALFGVPVLSRRMLFIWEDATERLSDRAAAEATGDPAIVAAALLAAVRSTAMPCSASFFPRENVASRIEALLSDAPLGARQARLLTRASATAILLVLGSGLAFGDALHHGLETILG